MYESLFFLLSSTLGALVGVVELFQRYKAEPFKVIVSVWGVGYIGLNAFVSFAAYGIWFLSQETHDQAALAKIQWAVICGFGAVAMLKAKLMTISTSDQKSIALGPEILVQTILRVIDRELDRQRAIKRFGVVRKLMKNIDYEKAKLPLPLQIFQSMQRISEEESEKMVEGIEEIDQMTGLSSQDKSYLLGFYLLDLVGENFLSELFDKYGEDFTNDMVLNGTG